MPEIKHQFTGGKMNKDVDERLVPNGEYRDAMNIQVSTSDESDVGTIQNLLGNSKITIPFDVTKHKCVGSIADESTDSVYFFLSGPNFSYASDTVTAGVLNRDYIIRLKNNLIEVVFSDVKLVASQAEASAAEAINPNVAFDNAKNTIYVTPGWAEGVSVGDVLEKIVNISSSQTKIVSHTVIYTHVSEEADDPEFIVLDGLDDAFGPNTTCYLFLRSGCLNFDADRSITGINIIDDMLFWTDGLNEPKKINIPRSIEGTAQDGLSRTLLINEDQSITIGSGINVREEHITVIKKAPSKPPTLQALTSLREDGVDGLADCNFGNGAGVNVLLKTEGDSLTINASAQTGAIPLGIEVGDTILLSSLESGNFPPESNEVRGVVNSVVDLQEVLELNITIISISPDTPNFFTEYVIAISEEGNGLFERKFPRFAYRYRYEDGEYSSIGPFSDVAFIPGNFRYHPTEAYNKGMINNIKSLHLKDFIPYDIPKDVVQVDLLYKDEASPAIYTVSSIKPLDTAWLAEGSFLGSFGSYKITTDNIYSILPSNQSLRVWDNVPRSALAQDSIGNRIVYANYLQGYNLETIPKVLASVGVRVNSSEGYTGKKSIKSLRTYNVGVVYGDEYGRETPVFSDQYSNQIITKDFAPSSTLINAQVNTPHPSWAKYYKFFVKETSNEYYNLALGRTYDAKDGNIWLAFPSADRNKVDEDTYLILKKGIESEKIVVEEGRYKIVAIENEAPEYIKTKFSTIARPVSASGINTQVIFAGTSDLVNTAKLPVVGGVSFYIKSDTWVKDISDPAGMGMPDLKGQWDNKGSSELYVSFIGDDTHFYLSKKYLITNVVSFGVGEAVNTAKPVYEVFISRPIELSDDWIANTPLSDITNTKFRPVIHKKDIINKPEFDGRFFVKIENDNTAIDNLTETIVNDTTWSIAAEAPLFYLRDADAPVYASDGTLDGTVGDVVEDSKTTLAIDGVGAVDNRLGNNVDGVFTKEQWKQALRFGNDNENYDKIRGRWFIDQTSYAGTQSLSTTAEVGRDTSNTFTDFETTHTYYSYFADISLPYPPYTLIHEAANITGAYGTGESLGKQWKTGLSSHDKDAGEGFANNKEHRLKLSYSRLLPDRHDHIALHIPFNGPRDLINNDWKVGAANTHTQSESGFASKIKKGSKFRMGGDVNKIYTITSVSYTRIYNFRAGIPIPLLNGGQIYSYDYKRGVDEDFDYNVHTRNQMVVDLASSVNRRVCYDITYTIDSGDLLDDLPLNLDILDSNALSHADFQFIEPFEIDSPEKLSTSPAIFETEPKEDAGLDIYYEASGRIPTSITGGDGEMLIPIGSKLRIEPEIANLYPGLSVIANGWGGSSHNFDSTEGVFQHNRLNILPSLYDGQALALTEDVEGEPKILTFDTVSGGTAYVKVLSSIEGVDGNIEAFGVEAINKVGLSWYNCWSFGNGVESNRIGDTFNKAYLSNGAKASATLEKRYKEEKRKYGLIYSGLYNSTSGVNNLNQFIAAEKITKEVNPAYGSIQKLHARNTADGDLIALCEDRILKILANKDALYNADGNSQLVANENVLGQTMPFVGEYGISKNPESFASESYRVYFTDKVRGAVMRLSGDGLTPISNHGMRDWFADNLKLSHKLVGGFDNKQDEYNLTLSPREEQTYTYRSEVVIKSTATVIAQTEWDGDDPIYNTDAVG